VIGGVWMRRCAEDPHPTPLPGGRGSKKRRRSRLVQHALGSLTDVRDDNDAMLFLAAAGTASFREGCATLVLFPAGKKGRVPAAVS
jgi:hypothetical protein